MKRNKIIAFVLAAVMLISVTPVAFAADLATVEENIAYLKANSSSISHLVLVIIPEIEKELEALKSNPDEEKINKIAEKVTQYRKGLDLCNSGTHTAYSYVVSAVEGPDSCKRTAICLYCNTYFDTINNNFYAQHHDKDKDDICDFCKKEMPYVNCNHFCHSNNIIIRKILLPIMKFIWEILDIEEYCECGMYHAHI